MLHPPKTKKSHRCASVATKLLLRKSVWRKKSLGYSRSQLSDSFRTATWKEINPRIVHMSAITILKRPLDEGVQTQRKFFRKTAKGKVVKGASDFEFASRLTQCVYLVLRERYLRDDVACGIQGICSSPNPPLPPRGDMSHSAFPNGHFILPDTNVFLHQVFHD